MSDRDNPEGVNPNNSDSGEDSPTEFIPQQGDPRYEDEDATKMFSPVDDPGETRAYAQTQIPEQGSYPEEYGPSEDHRHPYEEKQESQLTPEQAQRKAEEDRLREEEIRRQEQEQDKKAASSRKLMVGALVALGVVLVGAAVFALYDNSDSRGTQTVAEQSNPQPPPPDNGNAESDIGQLDGLRDQVDGLEEQNRGLRDRINDLTNENRDDDTGVDNNDGVISLAEVPPVIGETARSARSALRNAGFTNIDYVNPEGETVRPLISLPSDVVIDVTPIPGTMLDPDSKISVIVDKEDSESEEG